jgi:hypothetical protein
MAILLKVVHGSVLTIDPGTGKPVTHGVGDVFEASGPSDPARIREAVRLVACGTVDLVVGEADATELAALALALGGQRQPRLRAALSVVRAEQQRTPAAAPAVAAAEDLAPLVASLRPQPSSDEGSTLALGASQQATETPPSPSADPPKAEEPKDNESSAASSPLPVPKKITARRPPRRS